jgi:uncharacterized protein (TIGR01777 family)
MRILISGASGLIGSALRTALSQRGDETAALVRHSPSADEVQWTPEQPLDPQKLFEFDGIVHLAGKNIAGRWTEKFKREVRDSRVQGTHTLATAAAASFRQCGSPRVFIAASAIGYYGNRGDELLTEGSAPGQGFLSEVCIQWEAAADPAREAGLRVAHMRIGVVLAKNGGALPPLLLPFRLGLGGRIGDGQQWWSWVALEDVVRSFAYALRSESLTGPVNVVSSNPARVSDFVQALGEVLHRPTILPLPAFAARVLLGEMGETLLLDSARVVPQKLQASGYQFGYADLREALLAILSGQNRASV